MRHGGTKHIELEARLPPRLHEATPLCALSPYAAAKLAGEFYCQSFAAVYPLETVRLLQEKYVANSAIIGEFLKAKIEGLMERHETITAIRGRGRCRCRSGRSGKRRRKAPST